MTRVQAVLEGDTFFPVIDEKDWRLVSELAFPADEKHAVRERGALGRGRSTEPKTDPLELL